MFSGARPQVPVEFAPSRAPAAAPVRAFTAQPGSQPAALRSAITAESLAELGAALQAFEGCGLKATAKNLCLFRGAEQARLMIIGEAPGREEDQAGRPFAGPAGQMLDRMLAAIGRGEADTHITHTVYWRPPGNRAPTLLEVQACAPFLARQIELVGPEVILVLGELAARHVLGVGEGIMKLRGKWREIACGGRRIRALATLHPAHILRAPAAKRQVWRDLLELQMALAGA